MEANNNCRSLSTWWSAQMILLDGSLTWCLAGGVVDTKTIDKLPYTGGMRCVRTPSTRGFQAKEESHVGAHRCVIPGRGRRFGFGIHVTVAPWTRRTCRPRCASPSAPWTRAICVAGLATRPLFMRTTRGGSPIVNLLCGINSADHSDCIEQPQVMLFDGLAHRITVRWDSYESDPEERKPGPGLATLSSRVEGTSQPACEDHSVIATSPGISARASGDVDLVAEPHAHSLQRSLQICREIPRSRCADPCGELPGSREGTWLCGQAAEHMLPHDGCAHQLCRRMLPLPPRPELLSRMTLHATLHVGDVRCPGTTCCAGLAADTQGIYSLPSPIKDISKILLHSNDTYIAYETYTLG